MTKHMVIQGARRGAGSGNSVARPLSILLVMLFLIPIGLIANEGDRGVVKSVGPYKAEMTIGSTETKIGDNAITLRLDDGADKPVADAVIMLSIAMDKGSSMSMDMDKEKAKTVELVADPAVPGSYKGSANLDFAGKWVANMELSRAGENLKASFEFEVSGTGPNWVILGVFGLIIVLVVGGAVMLRGRKPVAVQEPAA